ncbi:hypothetical protein DFJ43DRAFT_800077 [Lentinula guzmanii]|uniref:Uncharacterized protein n=1 Tax=Lentinula guzmanii TaxID=2804957 RepID=A0AA38MWN0_9AGAR|nr:hypothetical protein DFJ43DRAFT_800077 [Lentinula guzmanii]
MTCSLYGVVLLEGFRYFKSYRDDSFVTKTLVALLCGLDTLHFGLSVHVAHHYLVQKFEDPNATVQIIWSNFPVTTKPVTQFSGLGPRNDTSRTYLASAMSLSGSNME